MAREADDASQLAGSQCCCEALWRRVRRRCARGTCFTQRRHKVQPERSRESRSRINRPPPPLYSAWGERARQHAPRALQCALFCGGARCGYEQVPQHATAIQGIYSDWITDDILAMARPSTAALAARNIIQQFHSWGIRTVINLQTPGEHASCGPPLTASGFTYDPAVFMANDIYYYNWAWADYGEASLGGLLDMAKVLTSALQDGRVAIHCHAGLGRTGVLIACYLVYALRVRANDAIRLVRKKRPRSVQTSGQILCVQQFEHYLLPQTLVFSSKEPLMLTKDKKSGEFTLRQSLHRQRATLHGLEERAFRELPKIVYRLCERLLQLCGCRGQEFVVSSRPFYRQFLVYRLRGARHPENNRPQDGGHEPAVPEPDHVCVLPALQWRNSVEENIERNLQIVGRITGGGTNGENTIPALHVHQAFTSDHHSMVDERLTRMRRLRDDINARAGAMDDIDQENDPVVLTGLLLEWLEGLRAPAVTRDQLTAIITKPDQVETCLRVLPQETAMLLEYLLRFVIRLRPLTANKRVDIMKRLLASLTHRTVSINGRCLPTKKDFPRLRDGTCNQVINFMLRMIVEIQKDMTKPGRDDDDVVMSSVPARRRIKAWK